MIRTMIGAIAVAVSLGTGAAMAAETPKETIGVTTEVLDQGALERLKHNRGVTLQWISWDRRGHLAVTEEEGVYHLKGGQIEGDKRLVIDGIVLRIDRDSFSFLGKIAIYNAPSDRKACLRENTVFFRITRNRPYWRLQDMSSCGSDATDYVDIYFTPEKKK